MGQAYVVVDGSNIATEGRATPSLVQLDEAVRQYQAEHPGIEVIVVVDATFGHRISEADRSAFDEAVAHGEMVSPPAGAVGRGDAFVLRIAERVGAQVLSNDSFQEFHGVHPWIFDEGRLIGGKPVPGVGWIFTPRTPVRGPRSRAARAAVRKVEQAEEAMGRGTSRRSAGRKPAKDPAEGPLKQRRPAVRSAVGEAVAEALEPPEAASPPDAAAAPAASGARRRRRSVTPDALNDPLTFLTFVTDHPLGSRVEGTVDVFVSHGAMVDVGGMRCYVPLSGLGSPPPVRAREVLTRGERRTFEIVALDTARRGAELALCDGTGGAPKEAQSSGPGREVQAAQEAGRPARRRRSG